MTGETNPRFEIPNSILGDILTLLWESGLFTELKGETQQWIFDNKVEDIIAMNGKPRLEPRMTLDEYLKHVPRILEVPQTEAYFYESIIRATYLMLLVEKNPLAMQEMRGQTQLSDQMSQFVKRGR